MPQGSLTFSSTYTIVDAAWPGGLRNANAIYSLIIHLLALKVFIVIVSSR
jgi:hypothetical protein